jgi:hypothetical protein
VNRKVFLVWRGEGLVVAHKIMVKKWVIYVNLALVILKYSCGGMVDRTKMTIETKRTR